MAAEADREQWNEERVARELERWFAWRAFEQWPGYRAFVLDGRKRLHAALMRAGGPQRWAIELGVPLVKRRPGSGLGDDEISAELRAILREHHPARFPSTAWLRRHRPPGLAAAVLRTGGGAHWARVLNIPPPQPARWTDALIEEELRRVCASLTRWPTREEFVAGRATGVRRAVYNGPGSHRWAQQLGVSTTGCEAVAGVPRSSNELA